MPILKLQHWNVGGLPLPDGVATSSDPAQVDGSRRDLFRYLTAEESADYLAIMDLFSATLLTDLSAEEVAGQLIERGVTLSRDTAETRCRQLRTSQADREQAIDVLEAAFVQGRLTKDEFSLRVGQVLASRTYADLGALTADIPGWVTSARSSAGRALEPGRGLSLYEVAHLCGGPGRVALTAVVTMHQDGRVKISPARHRVVVTRDEASHPVERAVLDAAQWPGMGLRFVLDEVAGSAAAHSAADELRRRGLLGKHSHLTATGRELRDELRDEIPEGLRIAVLGTRHRQRTTQGPRCTRSAARQHPDPETAGQGGARL